MTPASWPTSTPTHRRLGACLVAMLCACAMGGCGCPDLAHLSDPDHPAHWDVRDGDLILARSAGFLPAVYAKAGQPDAVYSHAALAYRAPDGTAMILHIRPLGLESVTLAEWSGRYYRLAWVRRRAGVDAEAIRASVAAWIERDRQRPVLANLDLTRERDDEVFCLELIDRIYADQSLPAPFRKRYPRDANPANAVVMAMLGVQGDTVPSPSSVLEEPAFARIAAWRDPDYDMRIEAIDDELAVLIPAYKLAGDRVAWPRPRGMIKLGLAHLGVKALRTFGGARLRGMIRVLLPMAEIREALMVREHIQRTRALVLRRMDAEPDRVWTTAEARAITREISDRLRPTYFTRLADCTTPARAGVPTPDPATPTP